MSKRGENNVCLSCFSNTDYNRIGVALQVMYMLYRNVFLRTQTMHWLVSYKIKKTYKGLEIILSQHIIAIQF